MRILVVCDANRARSPVAAAALARELADRDLPAPFVRIDSAGLHARDGDPAVAEVAEAAARLADLDLGAHRSRAVTDADLAADLILTMTARQRDVLAGRGAGVLPRAFTLRELVALVELAAADPDRAWPVADRGVGGPTLRALRLTEALEAAHDRRPLRGAVDAPDEERTAAWRRGGDGGADDIADPVGRPSGPDPRREAMLRAEAAVGRIVASTARLAEVLLGPR